MSIEENDEKNIEPLAQTLCRIDKPVMRNLNRFLVSLQ